MVLDDIMLINIEYVSVDSAWTYKQLNSLFYRLYYITDGSASVFHGGIRYMLKPDSLYLIPAYVTCDYYCPNSMRLYYIHFLHRPTGGFSLAERYRMVFESRSHPIDKALFKRLISLHSGKALKNKNPDQYDDYEKGLDWLSAGTTERKSLETRGVLMQLLSRFVVDERGAKAGNVYVDSRLERVIGYADKHIREKISVERLAGVACLHPEYFSKWFISLTSERPIDYINRKKIEETQRQLIYSEDTVEMIALKTGFYNHSHFIKTFRRFLGITPAQYRKINSGLLRSKI